MKARKTPTEWQITAAMATQRAEFEQQFATAKQDWADQIEAAKPKAHIGHWLTGAGVIISLLSLIGTLVVSLQNADRQILASSLQRADDAKFEARAAIQDQANRCLAVAQLGAQMAAGKSGNDARKALDLAAELDRNCANIRELAAAYMADRPAQFTPKEVAQAARGLEQSRDPAAVRLTDRFMLGKPQLRGFDTRGIGPRVERLTLDDAMGGPEYYQGRSEVEIPLGEGAKDLGLSPSVVMDVGQIFGLAEGKSPEPRVSIGAGVEWQSPFGPFRLDIARALTASAPDPSRLTAFNVATQF